LQQVIPCWLKRKKIIYKRSVGKKKSLEILKKDISTSYLDEQLHKEEKVVWWNKVLGFTTIYEFEYK
jgi:hypothetical protein